MRVEESRVQESLNNAKSCVESTSDNGEQQSEAEQHEKRQQEFQEQESLEIEQEHSDRQSEFQTDSSQHHSDSSKTSDYYEEEIITKVIHEDGIENTNSLYHDSRHEINSSYYNLEKIEDNFSQHAYEEHTMEGKGFDASEQNYEDASEKAYDDYDKEFENESGYEDFDRSFQENSGHHFHQLHNQNINNRNPVMGEPRIHRQHTFADIPPLPLKKTLLIKKQKTEDFTSSSTTTSTVPLLKRKPKPYPDPRKPAAYPQRLNKTTLARQALAREKRRIYVEERIQNFMRNTKSIQTPYGSLDRSFSIDRSNHKVMNSSFSLSKTSGDSKSKYERLHHISSSTTSQHRPNHDSLTTQISYRKSKIQSPQSLPDISIIDYYMAPSRGLLTSTPVSLSKSKLSSSHKSHHLSSSMSSIRSPTIAAEVSVLSGGTAGGGVGGGTTPRSGVVIDSIPEETSDFWKAISSEEGYFYTFRVRQTGPVQMLDKAVQTQTGPMNFSKDYFPSTSSRKRAPPLNNKSSTITLPLIDDRKSLHNVLQ